MKKEGNDKPEARRPLSDDVRLSLFREIIDAVDDALFISDQSGAIVYCNESFKRLCESAGCPLDNSSEQIDLASISFLGAQAIEECREVFASTRPVTSLLQVSGESLEISLRITRRLLTIAEGERYVLTSMHHIKHSAKDFPPSGGRQDLCNAIIDNSPIGISIRSRTGTLLGFNSAWQSIWHLSDKDIAERQQKPKTRLVFDDRDEYLGEWKEKVQQIYQHGGSLHIPELKVFLRRKKKYIWISQRFFALMTEDNTVDRVIIMTVDISDSVQSRQALQVSEDRYRQLVDIIPAAIAIIDYDGTIEYMNKYGAEQRGQRPEDVMGQPFFEPYPKELGRERLENIRRVIDTNRPFEEESKTVLKGSDYYHYVHIHPLGDDKNNRRTALVMAMDITGSKIAEKELQTSEARSRMLMDQIPSSIIIVDRRGTYKFMNKAAASRRGQPPEEFIGRNLFDMYKREEAEYILSEVENVYTSRQGKRRDVKLTINDTEYWFDSHALPVFDDTGKVKEVILIANDTTERKRAEQELAKSEANYRVLLNCLPANISVFSYDGTVLFMNTFAARTLGATPEEMVGKSQWDIFPNEIADQQMSHIRGVIDSGISETVESIVVVKGQSRWFTTSVQPYPISDGQTKAGMIIALDVTENKEAQREIKRSEEKLNSTLSSMDDLVFVIDKECRFVEYFQPSKRTLLFVPPEKFLGRHVGEIMPENIARQMTEKIQKVIETQEVEQLDYALDLPDQRQWYNARISILKDTDEEIAGVTVVARNITDRKQIENELVEAQKELENRVRIRTEELRDANEQLQIEREALEQKNVALQEILNQIEAGKQQMSAGIQANVDKIIMPILETLEYKITDNSREYVRMLRKNLVDITSPFMNSLESTFAELTPRELQICGHIRNGMSCKQIASTLDIAVQTVLKQRSIIRRKLGIANKKINLASYLKSMKN